MPVASFPVAHVTPFTTLGPVTTGHSTTFPPPPAGGMTYVNQFFGVADLYCLTHRIDIYNDPGPTSDLFLQLYDGDIGDSGQYYGIQSTGLVIWSQFGTNDTYNVQAAPGSTSLASLEEGGFISLRRSVGSSLPAGRYVTRVYREEFDPRDWSDVPAYEHGGDWWSYWICIPGEDEIFVGRMRFPREPSGLPSQLHDNGGTWTEFWDNNDESTLHPVPFWHVAVNGMANLSTYSKTTTCSYSPMPNSDIYATQPADRAMVHHVIGGSTTRHHDAGTLWSNIYVSPPSLIGGTRVNKIGWTTPADNGTPITGYKIYRGTTAGSLLLYATVGLTNVFFDTNWGSTTVSDGVTYYYAVSALNASGEGGRSATRSTADSLSSPIGVITTSWNATTLSLLVGGLVGTPTQITFTGNNPGLSGTGMLSGNGKFTFYSNATLSGNPGETIPTPSGFSTMKLRRISIIMPEIFGVNDRGEPIT